MSIDINWQLNGFELDWLRLQVRRWYKTILYTAFIIIHIEGDAYRDELNSNFLQSVNFVNILDALNNTLVSSMTIKPEFQQDAPPREDISGM